MPLSMTGFAQARCDQGEWSVACELRSVNGRYLDVSVRSDEPLRSLEPLVREAISGRLFRGKVECRIELNHGLSEQVGAINTERLNWLREACLMVRQTFPKAEFPSVNDLLSWPGVLSKAAAPPVKAVEQTLQNALHEAIDGLIAARAREGERLTEALLRQLGEIDAELLALPTAIDAAREQYHERLTKRLHEALITTDSDRLRQEMAFFAIRSDIDEEVTRLAAHLVEVRRCLSNTKEACGKRLDFLMQELNREANTMASKSPSLAITHHALTLKLLIEQMREQVQNLE